MAAFAALILLVKPSSSIPFLWEDSKYEIRKMEEFRDQHTVGQVIWTIWSERGRDFYEY